MEIKVRKSVVLKIADKPTSMADNLKLRNNASILL